MSSLIFQVWRAQLALFRFDMQRFGEKLRLLREQHGMTMRGLTHELGLRHHSYIARIEKGEAKPSLELVGKVARLFNVSFDQLMDDEVNLN